MHLAFFFSIVHQTCQPSPLCDHSQLHDRQAAPSRLCCCCAAGVVLYAHHVCVSLLCIPKLCSCFTLELRAVHASSHKNLQQFYCFVVPPVVAHLKKTQAKGNAAGATSGASSGQPASLPLLCCCSCATLIMYVCLCFVFPSCAVSPWSSELCMHPPTIIYIQQFHSYFCCVVPPGVTVVHFRKTQANGNVAGATSGASSGPPTSPPLLCCCSCATLIMYVCFCFVFPSCAVSPWSWELCMHPPTKIYSSAAVWSNL